MNNPIEWTELWRDELFIIVQKVIPSEARKSIRLKEIANESFIA